MGTNTVRTMMVAPALVIAEMEAATVEVKTLQQRLEGVLTPARDYEYEEDDYFGTS